MAAEHTQFSEQLLEWIIGYLEQVERLGRIE
jgi:hypothetical protein